MNGNSGHTYISGLMVKEGGGMGGWGVKEENWTISLCSKSYGETFLHWSKHLSVLNCILEV